MTRPQFFDHAAGCQKSHGEKHRAGCSCRAKEIKTAKNNGDKYDQFLNEADIDIQTFVRPPRPECPICFVPLPFEIELRICFVRCGKVICRACTDESMIIDFDSKVKRGVNIRDPKNCRRYPFCRQLPVEGRAVPVKKIIERGDAAAMMHLGSDYLNGTDVRYDERKAI